MQKSEATGTADRIQVLDALRGFALLGVLFANIRDWSAWDWLSDRDKHALTSREVAETVDFLHVMLVDGKFYTLFSFLFGIGFALQLSRLERRGVDGRNVFRRRLGLLFLFGIAHMSLLWSGDILALYAVLGFSLPLLRRGSNQLILTLAAFLILLPVPGVFAVEMLELKPDLGLREIAVSLGQSLHESWTRRPAPAPLAWAGGEGWASYWSWTLSGPPFRLGYFLESWRIPKVLGVMLLGIWAGRRLVDENLLGNRKLLIRVAVVGFAVGLPINAWLAQLGGVRQETAQARPAGYRAIRFGRCAVGSCICRNVLGRVPPLGRTVLLSSSTGSDGTH